MVTIRLLGIDRRGRICCPSTFAVRRVLPIEVVHCGEIDEQATREYRTAAEVVELLNLSGAVAAWAAFLEGFEGGLLCQHNGVIEKASLIERLRAGVVWS